MNNQNDTRLNHKDYLVILDVLNMFCKEDIPDFLPQMKTQQFSDEVGETFRKVLKIVDDHKEHKPEIVATTNDGQPWIWKE